VEFLFMHFYYFTPLGSIYSRRPVLKHPLSVFFP
jgi:hypothetical protein